jgi:ABC-type bacteriocin/lantibiotic exporter with double-glycine peptidase domain
MFGKLQGKLVPLLLCIGFCTSVVFLVIAIIPSSAQTQSANGSPDCGASSLYLVCKMDGRAHSLDFLRQLTKTTPRGTTMFDLKEATASLGYQVEAYRGSFASLLEHVGKPNQYAILHYKRGHFVTAVRSPAFNKVRVLDSALLIEDLAESELMVSKGWAGDMLLIVARD